MVALQIRDVPDEVRNILTERARQTGRSLQGYLLELVKSEAERANNLAVLRSFDGRTDGSAGSMEDTVRERDAARASREAELGGPGSNA